MGLIIETDLGGDVDDFFTLCYLLATGTKIDAITLVPGSNDQVGLVKGLTRACGLDIPVGVSKAKPSGVSGFHLDVMNAFGWKPCEPDGLGIDIIKSVANSETEFFVIGPATSVGGFLSKNPDFSCQKATMQGGFLPYHLHEPKVKLEKFENVSFIPTFNLNGNRPAGVSFLSANIARRQMVGKNVCHTVVYDKTRFERIKYQNVDHAAKGYFILAMGMYLDRHDSKKFHDPTAAVCHLHPEIGEWVRGRTVKEQSGWTTTLDPEGDYVLGGVDYEKLFEYLETWK